MSASPLGFVLPALALGAGALVFKPNRRGFFPFNSDGEALAPIFAQATIEEQHSDNLAITEHPVEVGAVISDHAYKLPAEVVIRAAWSNSPSPPASIVSQAVGLAASIFGFPVGAIAAAPSTFNAIQSLLGGKGPSQVNDIYAKFLRLQVDRIPFDILTGKRRYTNMVLQSIREDTTETTENSMVLVLHCKEVIIVATQLVTLDAGAQADPPANGPTQEQGNQNAGEAPTLVPDLGTVSGSIGGLSAGMGQLSSTLAAGAETLTTLSGPLAQLPEVVTATLGSVNDVLAQLPAPLNVPLINSAQILSIPLGAPTLGPEFTTALNALPASLDEAAVALRGAANQIPALTGPLTGVLTRLPEQITSTQALISNAARQLEKLGVH